MLQSIILWCWRCVFVFCTTVYVAKHLSLHSLRPDFFFLFSQYILSIGKDSLVKLWELSTNRCLIVYTGAGATGKMDHRTQAVFNHTEDYGQFHLTVVCFTVTPWWEREEKNCVFLAWYEFAVDCVLSRSVMQLLTCVLNWCKRHT